MIFVIGINIFLILGFDIIFIIFFTDGGFLIVNICALILRLFIIYISYEDFKEKMDFFILNVLFWIGVM